MDKTPMLPEQMTIPWAPPPRPGFIFSGANIIDPVKGTVLENATVYLRDGIVKSINGDATEWSDDPSAVKMDLRGKFVCPGLIDCHVHISAVPGMKNVEELKNMSLSVSLLRQPQVCKNMLERGFTTVRDCGGALAPLKLAIQDHVHPGPRLFIAGHALSQTGGHGDIREQLNEHECCGGTIQGIGRVIDGVPDCLKYTREELRQGVDFIKIMGGGGVASPTDKIEHVQFSDEEIKAIVTVASNAGTYVTSHAYTPQAIRQAVNQGVLAIEHGNLIDKETADLMAARGVFLTPTLVAYATMAKFEGFLPPDSAKKNREVLEKGLQAIKIAAEAGVTICFGSDLLGGLHFAQSHEFGLRSQVQSSLEVLRSATINAARLLRQETFLGQVAPGFAADLLILNANPLDDITVLDTPEKHVLATIKDGRVHASRWSELETYFNRPKNIA
ncbi:linoleate diol synthase [Fusarium globosum]|uniref:Linoleate diol synthase n=1 Tax=Fusarium globosum TaxID=78864 RepID=A0A8H6D4S7_9HYPO|nr:linoleate diol synthase [Fusarium globosum]